MKITEKKAKLIALKVIKIGHVALAGFHFNKSQAKKVDYALGKLQAEMRRQIDYIKITRENYLPKRIRRK